LKILHVINTLNVGGAEKLLVDAMPLYKEKENVECLLLNGNETPFYKKIKEQGSVIHFLCMGNVNKIYNPFLTFRLIPYLKRYDIVHVHLFPSLYWVAMAKWLSHNKSHFIFTDHSSFNKRRKNRIFRFLDKFIYSQYEFIVSNSEETEINIKKHLLPGKYNFKQINNGVDLHSFSHLFSIGTLNMYNDINVVQVANFRPAKDHNTLIRAFKYLPINVKLILVGDGETRFKYEMLVKELHLSERVSFLGSRSDIPNIWKNAHIGVLSSHWEGFGLVAVEAMASGKPFIASDVPGLRHIVDGAGLLFEKGNEKDLAKKIMSLVNDDEFYKRVSQQCFERAKMYDINTMVEKYLELYHEVLNK